MKENKYEDKTDPPKESDHEYNEVRIEQLVLFQFTLLHHCHWYSGLHDRLSQCWFSLLWFSLLWFSLIGCSGERNCDCPRHRYPLCTSVGPTLRQGLQYSLGCNEQKGIDRLKKLICNKVVWISFNLQLDVGLLQLPGSIFSRPAPWKLLTTSIIWGENVNVPLIQIVMMRSTYSGASSTSGWWVSCLFLVSLGSIWCRMPVLVGWNVW